MLKRLLNRSEEITSQKLEQVAREWSARTFAKVRLADLLPISGSGITDAAYRYALQAHFDFVVTDNDYNPLFAVEYDGPSHRSPVQWSRDELKDHLCRVFELPLLRINARYLRPVANGLDVLAWCTHTWFSTRVVIEAERSGRIEPGEVCPGDIVLLSSSDEILPLWLTRKVRGDLWAISAENPELDPVPTCLVACGAEGEYRALAILRVTRDTGLLVKTGMRAQNFAARLDELVEELVVLELWEKYQGFLRGELATEPIERLRELALEFRDRHTILTVSTSGDTLFLHHT